MSGFVRGSSAGDSAITIFYTNNLYVKRGETVLFKKEGNSLGTGSTQQYRISIEWGDYEYYISAGRGAGINYVGWEVYKAYGYSNVEVPGPRSGIAIKTNEETNISTIGGFVTWKVEFSPSTVFDQSAEVHNVNYD